MEMGYCFVWVNDDGLYYAMWAQNWFGLMTCLVKLPTNSSSSLLRIGVP